MNQLSDIVTQVAIFFTLTTVILLAVVYQKDKRLEEIRRRFITYLDQLGRENWKLKEKNTKGRLHYLLNYNLLKEL